MHEPFSYASDLRDLVKTIHDVLIRPVGQGRASISPYSNKMYDC